MNFIHYIKPFSLNCASASKSEQVLITFLAFSVVPFTSPLRTL